jgi:hypothetical protein
MAPSNLGTLSMFQIELILLAIRNGGLVLPSIWRRANWILLGDVVLSQLEQVISYGLSDPFESYILVL